MKKTFLIILACGMISGCASTGKSKYKSVNENEVPEKYTRDFHKRRADVEQVNWQMVDSNCYIASFNSNNNQYTFSNIANLLRVCYEEHTSNPECETENPDWNKVVLIPVKVITDSNGYVIKITHDTDIKSIKLRGGEAGHEIPIEIISSKFND